MGVLARGDAAPLNVGIVWDAEDRLVEVRQGATTLARFVYDGFGRRQQKIVGGVVRTNVWDGSTQIEEGVSSGQTLRYVEGPKIDQHLAIQDTGVVAYYLTDHLGSVVRETSSAGATTLTRSYDPWGNLVAGVGRPGWAFTGREWDPEIGLYYYRARYFAPALGRFASEDPSGFEAGVNFYGYALANPTTLGDPYGLDVVVCLNKDALHGIGHVGFGVSGETGTQGFYSRDHETKGPGAIKPDDPSDQVCKTIPAYPHEDACMQRCRENRRANPGEYNVATRQCTRFVRDCLVECNLPAGNYFGPLPKKYFKSIPETTRPVPSWMVKD